MYYVDLSDYTYSERVDQFTRALNVGWLDIAEPFTSGTVPEGFAERLEKLRSRRVNLMRGYHACPYCLAEYRKHLEPHPVPHPTGGPFLEELFRTDAVGNGEIFVVGKNRTSYHAPVMITHYVRVHGYLPPAEFIEAVGG